jgi:hypothetical protein
MDGIPSRKPSVAAATVRVVAHIGAVIDPGNDDVRQFRQQPGYGEMHAIGWRAVDVIKAAGGLSHRQRAIQGQRVAGTAAVAFRGNYSDRAQRRECTLQGGQARRKITVVVAEQDAHAGICRFGVSAAPRLSGGVL